MPGACCGKGKKGKHRKHTPIKSRAEFGFMGTEYARKKKGKKGKTDMPLAELKRHIKEAKGKKLPARAKRNKRR